MKPVNRIALHKAVWASLSRIVSVILGAGAGSILRDVMGHRLEQLGVAAVMAVVAWLLMLYAEYMREH